MTSAFATAQYAKDAAMDNSRIIFSPHTGDPVAWTDTSGKAHRLPVDFKRVSAATREQFRSYWLDAPLNGRSDEQTMDHVQVRVDGPLNQEQARQFYREQNARDDAADRRDEDMRAIGRDLGLIGLGALVGAAAYPLIVAVIDVVMR